jgi:hypothetical protein
MNRSHSLCLFLLLSIPLVGGKAVAQVSAPSPVSVDARRLEISEELSESLANDLLELSVVTKNRDLQKTAPFFPEELAADTFPSEPSDTKPEVKWIMSHAWTAKTSSAPSLVKTGRIKATDFLGG